MLVRIPLGPAASRRRVENAPLRFGGAATDRSALFTGFTGPIGGSDVSPSCIIGYGFSGLPDADRRQSLSGQTRDLPVAVRTASLPAWGP